jgi:polyphosphate kinase
VNAAELVGLEQTGRQFRALRQWKLSPMDTESFGRWYDYSRPRDMMFEATDTAHAPWRLIRSDDKRRARLNVISHILKTIPLQEDRARPGGPARHEVRRGTLLAGE